MSFECPVVCTLRIPLLSLSISSEDAACDEARVPPTALLGARRGGASIVSGRGVRVCPPAEQAPVGRRSSSVSTSV